MRGGRQGRQQWQQCNHDNGGNATLTSQQWQRLTYLWQPKPWQAGNDDTDNHIALQQQWWYHQQACNDWSLVVRMIPMVPLLARHCLQTKTCQRQWGHQQAHNGNGRWQRFQLLYHLPPVLAEQQHDNSNNTTGFASDDKRTTAHKNNTTYNDM